jgi:hypothetical protein
LREISTLFDEMIGPLKAQSNLIYTKIEHGACGLRSLGESSPIWANPAWQEPKYQPQSPKSPQLALPLGVDLAVGPKKYAVSLENQDKTLRSWSTGSAARHAECLAVELAASSL